MGEFKLRRYGAMGLLFGLLFFVGTQAKTSASAELSCYQCEKNTSTMCDEKDLKPCAISKDRCVTHISKNERDGFKIKRECGLAPCTFEDDMASKGLGLQCDQSKPEYSCLFCCQENGCNKNGGDPFPKANTLLYLLVTFYVLLICLLNVARDFIPPYVEENKNI